MKIIDLYLARVIIGAIFLVTLVLLGIQLFILFVEQLDMIGRGDYDIWQAFRYVGMQMPAQLYLLFPVACLLGSLIGLGLLASNNELTVMRASGMSIGQMIITVFKTAILLIVVVTVLGELFIPKLLYNAEIRKAVASSGGKALSTLQGVWLRDKGSLIHIGTVERDYRLHHISQYQFNKTQELTLTRYARLAAYEDDAWILSDVQESHINPDKITTVTAESTVWDVTINPRIISLLAIEPEEMTITQLYRYIEEQRTRQLQTAPYELNFFKRIVKPFAALVMMFLAIPFIFGPLRSVSASARIVTGATVGFSFYMLDKFFGPVSLVYQIPPLAAAIIPTLLFTALGFYLLHRAR